MNTLKVSDTHEWRHDGREWGLHYLPSETPDEPLRMAARFEGQMLDAAKKAIEDATHKALVAIATKAAELDAAGNPKLKLTVLEALGVDACNLVKAWAESDRRAPFPEDAHMKADAFLMMATMRRTGVR